MAVVEVSSIKIENRLTATALLTASYILYWRQLFIHDVSGLRERASSCQLEDEVMTSSKPRLALYSGISKSKSWHFHKVESKTQISQGVHVTI